MAPSYIFRDAPRGDFFRRSPSTMVLPRTWSNSAPHRAAISSTSISVLRSHRTFTAWRVFSWERISSIVPSETPFFPIQIVAFSFCIDSLPSIPPHHRVSHLVSASLAGDDHATAMHPHPHVYAGNEIGMAPSAVTPAQLPRDPDTLAH
jgi:hypothetical protein